MKMYKLKPNGKGYVRAVVDIKYPDKVVVKLWKPKPNFDQIPLGENHYDYEILTFDDKKGYLSLLFDRKPATTARKYLKQLGLKIAKVIL